jgi:hypothetical protein
MPRWPLRFPRSFLCRVVVSPPGMRGERPENVAYPGAAAPLQRVWIALRANERAVLETVALADIVSGELPSSVAILTDSPQAWVSARA